MMQVDFSAYQRIGYLGALLADDGSVLRAKGWNDEHRQGLVRALDHGVGLDLVLYRRDFSRLLAVSEAARQPLLRRAARELAAMVDTPLQAWWRPWLRAALPGWPQHTHLYSGVTLFFDELPATEAGQRFLIDFVNELVPQLERSPRTLSLQVVVSGDRLVGGSGQQGMAAALRLMERTGSISPAGEAGVGASPPLRPKLRVRLLVLLPEPTTQSKKALRAALDETPLLQSHQRIDFLDSLIPMMNHPAGPEPGRMSAGMAFQFDADLAYHGWQYGGAGLWPVVDLGRGAGTQVMELLHQNFRANERWYTDRWAFTHALCSWVCPNRTAWRLALNGLLVLGGVSLLLFSFNCRVRAWGRPMVAWMLGGLAVTGLVFWLLLTCDPALYELSESNWPLVGLFLGGLAAALWALSQRRVPPP
jgi:hypothetical protein